NFLQGETRGKRLNRRGFREDLYGGPPRRLRRHPSSSEEGNVKRLPAHDLEQRPPVAVQLLRADAGDGRERAEVARLRRRDRGERRVVEDHVRGHGLLARLCAARRISTLSSPFSTGRAASVSFRPPYASWSGRA